MSRLLLAFVSIVSGSAQQASEKPISRSVPQTKAVTSAKKQPAPISGFAVAPMVLADEGCARDYVRAFHAEGVELRKKLADLEAYGCLDRTATGIFAAVSTDRKDFSVDKEHTAYFRKVVITYDRPRTQVAVESMLVKNPGKPVYTGWILDQDFYAVTAERFDQLLVEKKIPISLNGNR